MLFLKLYILIASSSLVTAHSIREPPLNSAALSHPTFPSTVIIPRSSAQLNRRDQKDSNQIPSWDDNFYLSFTSHGSNITLSLRPSTNIIHPDGINSLEEHVNEKGIKSSVNKKIGRDEFKIYEGFVLDDSVDREQWTREEMAGLEREATLDSNWARIVLLNVNDEDVMNDLEDGIDGEGLRFQGTYSIDSETYTIHSTPNYLRTRQFLDPDPPLIQKRSTLSHPSMIIVRDGHTLSPGQHIEALQKRGLVIPESLATTNATAFSCGHDNLPFNSLQSDPDFASYPTSSLSSELFGERSTHGRVMRRQDGMGNGRSRSNYQGSIGSTAGCPTNRQVVFIGVAADCSYTGLYGSPDAARTQILTDLNTASNLYTSTFNVALGIIHLNVQSGTCPTSAAAVDPANPWNVGCEAQGGPGLALSDRLSVFSSWRGGRSDDRAGLWHLVTNCASGPEVGVAWLAQLCQARTIESQGQATSGTGVSSVTTRTWAVIAHEIGHNFGAIHDCVSGCTQGSSNPTCCPFTATSCNSNADFIMSPVSSKPVTAFSPCSIGNVCTALSSQLNTTCLTDPGQASNPTLISLQSCGNGILEAGEDCDPGGTADPCCNAATCKFASGAVCSPLDSNCCQETCQLAAQGTVCRPSVDGQCDVQEVCSGTSAVCPVDAFTADGTSCGANNLACASGVCTSLAMQCTNLGSSLGITQACRQTTQNCRVTCQSPSSSNTCIVLDSSFRDGSPCGFGGKCKANVCEAGSSTQAVESWYKSNLQISIPVTIAAAVVLILIIFGIWKCCSRSKQKKMNPHRPAPSSAYQSQQFNQNRFTPSAPQPMYQPGQYQNYPSQPQYQQPQQGGYTRNFPPPPPPPRY